MWKPRRRTLSSKKTLDTDPLVLEQATAAKDEKQPPRYEEKRVACDWRNLFAGLMSLHIIVDPSFPF
jgi:hypothetical protein